MTTFTVARISQFDSTIQRVYKLIRDGKCLLDPFIEEHEDSNLEGELTVIYQIIEDVANCKVHPKCRKLQLGKSRIQGYEAKSKHLRTYFFHEKGTGQIVVIGGTKKNQVQDIDRLKKIIKEYQRFKEGKR